MGSDSRGELSGRRIRRLVLFAVLIGVGVTFALSISSDWARSLDALRRVRIDWFTVPLGLCVLSQVIDALRLMLVLSQLGVRIGFARAFYNSAGGSFFASITPLTAGGQPFQIYHLSSIGVPADTATNVIGSRLVEQGVTGAAITLLFAAQFPSIADRLGIGTPALYVGLGISIAATAALLVLLFKPVVIGGLARIVDRTALGSLLRRGSRGKAWASDVEAWCYKLQRSVRELWSQKPWIMIVDTILGMANTALHACGILYTLNAVTGGRIPFVAVAVIYVLIWQVLLCVPTPGASGGAEGAFALAYSGVSGGLGPAVVAVVAWRMGSYYALLVFDGIVYALLRRTCRGRGFPGLGAQIRQKA